MGQTVAAPATARMPAPAVPRLAVAAQPGLVRLAAFTLLGAFVASGWGSDLVAPSGAGRGVVMALAATGAGAAMLAAAGIRHPVLRHGACALSVLVAMAIVLEAAGVGARLLAPAGWGDLAAGVNQGLGSLPETTVPYQGVDEWVRTVILAGAGALLVLGAAAAFWPRPGASRVTVAAVLLGVTYAVPVVERNISHPFLSGAVFALLLAGLLWAEQLERDQTWIAVVLGSVALTGGLLLAPRLDGARPLLDPQHLADQLGPTAGDSFDWTHRYGPLNWPRDGREVLRIKAQTASYWKAVNLTRFDGVRWRQQGVLNPRERDTEFASGYPQWSQTITVVFRSLRSYEFITAGTAREISATQKVRVMESPGTFVTGGKALGPGDSYRARVYTPRPSQAQLNAAGTRYPDFTGDALTMDLPAAVGGPQVRNPFTGAVSRRYAAQLVFPSFGQSEDALAQLPDGTTDRSGSRLLRASGYARSYALAQGLAAQSASPYDFVRRVQRRVQANALYSESPPLTSIPLETFLFGNRIGYCQQFSGAMALLLRMGGVPARVASGFAPGSYDRKRREYVIRDLDAHSWVEAYFPVYGWVPFDPTPSIAPPRSQASSESVPSAAAGDASDKGGIGDRTSDPRAGGRAGGGGSPWRLRALIGLAGALLALSLVRLDRSGHPAAPPVDPDLTELVRALRRSGRMPPNDMTLARLETVLGGTDAAVGYLQAVRAHRYGDDETPPPTRAQRRALRRELAAGLGPLGRIRGWWALPPRVLHSKSWPTSTSSSATGSAFWRRATFMRRPSH
jgi:transglutaminase-like putative cysteine protease